MSNTTLQIRRSVTNTAPASLANGELAYSGNSTSNSLFIGHPDGTTGVVRIGGGAYGYVFNSTPGTLTVNAAMITDANGYISNIYSTGLFLSATKSGPVANTTAALIRTITPQANTSQLGGTAGGSNTELATTWAVVTYIAGQTSVGAVNTAAQFNWTNTHTFNAAVTIVGNTTATLTVGNSTVNVVTNATTLFVADGTTNTSSVNTTAIVTGNSTVKTTINSTAFSGIANNASNFNGQPASFYTNATNITTGTLPAAQLPATTVNTSGSFTFAGVETFNANVAIVGNTTGELLIGATAANIIANATTITLATNSTVSATLNSTIFSATSSNATNLNSQPGSFYTNATNITTGILPWAQAPAGTVNTSGTFSFGGIITHNANLAIVGNTTGELLIGATAANIIANATTITLATNSTVAATLNSTVYSATANNASNFNGQPGSFYTNATNITTGTLPWAQAPTNSVNTTGNFTFGGVEIFNANVTIIGNTTATFTVGNSTVNAFVNATTFIVGNTTQNAVINSSTFFVGNSTVFTQVNTSSVNTGTITGTSLTLSGNLTVLGSTLIVNSTVIDVNSNFIGLADTNQTATSDVVDMGWYGEANSLQQFTATVTSANNWLTTISINPVGIVPIGAKVTAAANATWTANVTSVNSTVIVLSGNFIGSTTVGNAINTYGTSYYGMYRVASNNTFIPFYTPTQPGVTVANINIGNAAFNTIGLTTALGVTSGGTGLGTIPAGAVLTGNTTGTLTALGVGANGNVLQIINNLPAYGGIDCGAF